MKTNLYIATVLLIDYFSVLHKCLRENLDCALVRGRRTFRMRYSRIYKKICRHVFHSWIDLTTAVPLSQFFFSICQEVLL